MGEPLDLDIDLDVPLELEDEPLLGMLADDDEEDDDDGMDEGVLDEGFEVLLIPELDVEPPPPPPPPLLPLLLPLPLLDCVLGTLGDEEDAEV